MNNEEAKLILQAYRPGGEDAEDPQFHEALEKARLDPDLAAWLANELELDARIGGRIRDCFKPPAHLKSRILAERKIVRPSIWARRSAWKLAAAACVAALLALGIFWSNHEDRNGFAGYRAEMAGFVGHRLDRLDLMSHDLAEVRRWLSEQAGQGELILPAGLERRSSLGCRLVDWQRHTVSLVCFDIGNGHVAHLLVIDRASLADAPAESPVFRQIADVATVGWSRGQKTYLVASQGGTQLDLMKLF
jgi:hypothetical protein